MAFKNKGVAFIVGAVAGTVVGSVTALLLAPKSGKELRGDIKAGTEKVIEAGSDAVDHVSETVYEVSKKLEDRTAKAVNSAKQGVQHAVAFVKRSKATGAADAGTEAGSEMSAEADQEEAVAIDTDVTGLEAVGQSDAKGLVAKASETGAEAKGESEAELEAAKDASQAKNSKQQQDEAIGIVQ